MSNDAQPRSAGLSDAQTALLAAACAFAIATLYYNQPILPLNLRSCSWQDHAPQHH